MAREVTQCFSYVTGQQGFIHLSVHVCTNGSRGVFCFCTAYLNLYVAFVIIHIISLSIKNSEIFTPRNNPNLYYKE